MRWFHENKARNGELRVITVFTWWPKTLRNVAGQYETRWLEFAKIKQFFHAEDKYSQHKWIDLMWN
jgi:hypothetical protein